MPKKSCKKKILIDFAKGKESAHIHQKYSELCTFIF